MTGAITSRADAACTRIRPSAAGASPAQSHAKSMPGSRRPPRITPALTTVSMPGAGSSPSTSPAPAPARGRQRGAGGGASRASAGTSARRTLSMIASITASASSRLWQSLLSESSVRTPSGSPPRVDSTTSARCRPLSLFSTRPRATSSASAPGANAGRPS